MAKQLDESAKLGRRAKYDWDSWTNGRVWEIRRGEDYAIETLSMQVQLHMKSKELGKNVVTRTIKDGDESVGLTFQFVEKENDTDDAEEVTPNE
jgi:hypothetical protein